MKMIYRCPLSCVILLLCLFPKPAFAHCQIPCGLYDDDVRFKLIHEHITTLEKSISMIKELSAEGEKNYNQIIRWVNNKDKHADEIQEIVTQYFMTQRLKPTEAGDKAAQEKYVRELILLHKLLIAAMKTKQTVDLENTQTLHNLLEEFKTSYLGEGKGAAKETPQAK